MSGLNFHSREQRSHPDHHPKRAKTALEGDLLGRDIIIWDRELLPPEKIVCKKFLDVLENAKSFSERFFEAVRLSLY